MVAKIDQSQIPIEIPLPSLFSDWFFDSMATPEFQTGFMGNDDREKLRKHFLNQPPEEHSGRWDALYQQNTTPWDRKGPSLALKDAVTGRQDILGSPFKDQASGKRKRAFVPGCGRGYDVLLLASLGYDAYGLDMSDTANRAAKQLQAETGNSGPYEAHSSEVGSGAVTFIVNDFFSNDFLQQTGGENFDLIFDYTFFCALPPTLRPKWAKRMSELLAPNGHLICLEWPLGKDPKTGGPPYGLTSDLYVQLYLQPGNDVQYQESGIVANDQSRTKSSNALSRVAHFMPERTHEAGKGKDYISIWSH